MSAEKKPSNAELTAHIEQTIPDFHHARLSRLGTLKLRDLLRSKNPYLYRAKNILLAQDLVIGFLNAHLSSQEETMFGTFLERVAVFVAERACNGRKSSTSGIDLELEKDGILYLVTIKSGPDWGNASQIAKMLDYFRKAMMTLRTNAAKRVVICVNGCCYGRSSVSDRMEYRKLCGQAFWEFLSDDPELYTRMIAPIGHRAKERNQEFAEEFAKVVNRLTQEMLRDFCTAEGAIDWNKLLIFNSGKPAPRTK